MYTASQIVHKVSNCSGLEVSAAVIKKWYYELLKEYLSPQEEFKRMSFTEKDLTYFQLVATMRGLMLPYPRIQELLACGDKTAIKTEMDGRINKMFTAYNALINAL